MTRALIKTIAASAWLCSAVSAVAAQSGVAGPTLFQNVRIFDGTGSTLSAPSNVLVRDNRIERVSSMPTTGTNAELLALSGKRNPYPGKLGVVEEGALADLLLVDGNPLENIALVADPARNVLVIMKDGVIHKSTLGAAR